MGIETALIGSAIIGGVSANSASKRAAKSSEDAQQLSKQGIALQQREQQFNEQRYMDAQLEYDKWKAIYGPLQEDLGTYFRNLTGESLSNSEVTRIQEASQKSKDKIRVSMAQRGIVDGGLENYLLAQNDYQAELAKADSRSTAEQRAIQSKSEFLAMGLNQANTIKNQQAGITGQLQQGVNNQITGLNNVANIGMQGASQQSGIWSNYGNQLQGLVGYGSRMDAFGGQNTAGTTAGFNTTLEQY